MRDMVFISHANPEDNDFSLWLALQLAKEGYPVWCDMTQFLGGEDFWKDAEKAIRERTVKFLYVLSKTSNWKDGPLQELQVAKNVANRHKLKDFIIPLHIDDLSHGEINIQLTRIISIPFYTNWANGLNLLLQNLEKDNVPKNGNFTPETVANWWRSNFSSERGLIFEPEEYLSNWFPIKELPSEIYFHLLKRTSIGKYELPEILPYPAFLYEHYLVSFAGKDDFEGKLGSSISISDSIAFNTIDFLNEDIKGLFLDKTQRRDIVLRLLKLAWEKLLSDHKLLTYELTGNNKLFYFTPHIMSNGKITFIGIDEKKTYRKVIGTKLNKFWQFGIQAKPILYPLPAYIIKPHVVFSDDGFTTWHSKEKLHKARRSYCKNWWNADWRDRILAVMQWLSRGQEVIEIRAGIDRAFCVSSMPLIFSSPVSYIDPERYQSQIDEITDEEDYLLDENDDEH